MHANGQSYTCLFTPPTHTHTHLLLEPLNAPYDASHGTPGDLEVVAEGPSDLNMARGEDLELLLMLLKSLRDGGIKLKGRGWMAGARAPGVRIRGQVKA